jgi:hypothetical protein
MSATGRAIRLRRAALAVAASGLAVASLLGAAGGAAAARPATGLHFDSLLGVSCARASACTAVGSYVKKSGLGATLAEDWNGSAWKARAAPNPAGARPSGLVAISCPALGSCMAVGSYLSSAGFTHDLAEVFNHGKWHLAQAADPYRARLSNLLDVSCWKPARCVAVGYVTKRSGRSLLQAEVWTGTKFRVLTPPEPKGAMAAFLTGAHCRTASSCMAAGFYTNQSFADTAFAEAWDGKHWHVLKVPVPAIAKAGLLQDVACPTKTTCLAVGEYFEPSPTIPLAEARLSCQDMGSA